MVKLSVVIISFNEEEFIERCIVSVRDIADEIFVLDSFSGDKTSEICKRLGVRFEQHKFDGYIIQKNRALGMAANDIILSLDADEALSEEAIREVIKIKNNWQSYGYYFNRSNHYCGRWMRHTSLYPDRKLRLFDRRHAWWTGYDPHDFVRLSEGVESHVIKADILHWVIDDRNDHLQKAEHFSSIAAKAYFEGGKNAQRGQALVHACWRFIQEFFVKLGFLEGRLGFQFACISARYVFLKYIKLRDLYAKRT